MSTAHYHSMEQSKSQATHSSKRFGSRKFLIFSLLTIAVLVIAIPVAVMFGKKEKKPIPRSTVIVPLYVYPDQGAWDPLFTAIATHPDLNFTVVVNPANGPGSGFGPDANYTREIPKLNSYANVRTVGYVSTHWAKRDVVLALKDVSTYSKWAENSTVSGLDMHGIFLDETPTEYNDSSAKYYETIASAIRSASGLGNDPLIIHNPGQIPDSRYLASCDLTVVFEETYSTYQIYGFRKNISSFRKSAHADREALACVIHSIPTTLRGDDFVSFVEEVRGSCGSIFMTGLSVDYYSSFWAGLEGFVGGMLV